MDSDSETEESVAIARTYDKMKTSVHKIGFVEGLTSGKEAAFQNGFDSGYKEGFKSGYQLSKLNGVLRVLQEKSKNDDIMPEVVRDISMEPNAKRGMCLMCNPQNMDFGLEPSSSSEDHESGSLERIIKVQQETISHAVCSHLTKVKKAYELYNISVAPNILDLESIDDT